MTKDAKAWEETVTLPTYPEPSPDLNPMFLEKRVNQGTSGRVYPYPFTDKVSDESEPQEYQAVYLENDYIRLMILPQIGGRIHEGYDKTNGYHFIYRQHVIKPALIGLLGSWISGGVEFNWPQHHRPSTFMPTHHLIEEAADGSVTVWLSENDPMQRMKGMVGICLYPGKAFFEMKVQLYNRTPEVQSFLWWINFAVHVHDAYQVVFPPDVTTVTDHSKRSMSYYPMARGTYYGIDYSDDGEGTDISWYKNVPVATSYFVWETGYDYFGGYDHRADAGVIHVANRHIAPGKKMFTWGAGEFGKGWEANLTDTDGPYIELMAGVYTDNQPDFSWLQPYETKTFSQFWYPVQEIGPAKNANRRVAVNLEVPDGEPMQAKVGVAVTEAFQGATVTLRAGDEMLLDRQVDLAPGAPLVTEVALPDSVGETDLLLRVLDGADDELIRYAPQVIEEPPLPEAKTPPPPPETFDTIEELYLTGLHLEQYRHPTIDPEPYWEATLAKDPMDVRCNNAMGLVNFRRGKFETAADYFQTAIDKLTRRNPNPRDGEPYYNLGAALKYQGDLDDAYDAYYKAIWSYAWQAAGYYALAQIDIRRRDFERALEHLERSLRTNTMNTKARNLKAAVLRHLGRLDEAAPATCETVELDPLDMWSRNEAVLVSRAQDKEVVAESQLAELMDFMEVPHRLSKIQAYLDLAFDYFDAGLWKEAEDVLTRLVPPQDEDQPVFPTVLYALGYIAYQLGREAEGKAHYRRASAQPVDYCFPERLDEMLVLEHAQSVSPDDAKVAYYLGNLYYDKKRYDEAIANWERAVELAPDFAIPWRNLGIAYYNVRDKPEKAIAAYEKAFELAPEDGRVLSELDQLRQRTGVSPEERLALLEEHMDLVRDRDDLSVAIATLYNETQQPQKALDYALSRRFHPWEGGTGLISRQYVKAHLRLGQAALDAGDAQTALSHFETAQATYPENLGERKNLRWPDAGVQYYTGLARQKLGDEEGARASFERVLEASRGPVSETAYYQALALKAMGEEAAAIEKLETMLDKAKERLAEQAEQGFATSVPEFVFAEEDLETRRRIHLNYLIGLALKGLGRTEKAKTALEKVLDMAPNHGDARIELQELA
ncbi:MAG: DUF5107 domain-containing protein [Anaerolineae bacterium]